jgi:protein phosphatase
MGGHLAGEVASQTAVETMLATFPQTIPSDIPAALNQSFIAANKAVFERGRGNMGTTAVALLIYHNVAFIANVGDSRAYLVRNGELRQLSLDHSFVEEQVRAGLLTPEQARHSNIKNIITRAVGHQRDVQVDVFREPVEAGDIYLLCSDGLHGYVEEETLLELLQHAPLEQAALRMIQLANEAGGPDNITAVLIQIDELDPQTDNDPLLASLLATATPTPRTTIELPVEGAGPTGTAKMPVMNDDPVSQPLGAPVPLRATGTVAPPLRAAAPPAPPAPPRERGLNLWGAFGAVLVLGVLAGVLYWFNLPPMSLLFDITPTAQTSTAVAVPTKIPTVTLQVQTTPLSATNPLSPSLTLTPPARTPLATPLVSTPTP